MYSRGLGGEIVVLYGAVRGAMENVVRAGGEPPKEYRVQQCSLSTRQTLVPQTLRPNGRAILTSSLVQSATINTLNMREIIRKQAKLRFFVEIVLSSLKLIFQVDLHGCVEVGEEI